MTRKNIYVLHEYGAPSHYNGLIELCKNENYNVKFFVFSGRAFSLLILHLKFNLLIANLCFLISLLWKRNEKIVLGIAPYNKSLPFLMWLLRKNKVYYHTSYTCWDGSYAAYPSKSKKLINKWLKFTKLYSSHIFAVSEKSKSELIKNGFANKDKISVVKHSYNIDIPSHQKTKNNRFIYVGRLIPSKGIKELLDIFSNNTDMELIIVGTGELHELVAKYADKYPNIEFKGYINGLKNLIPLYQSASFVLMNSKRTDNWEELFGISLIEGMAAGCVPITTDHSGPMEIITISKNGFICKENLIFEGIQKAKMLTDTEYYNMQKSAIETGQSYHSKIIANRWRKILD